MEPDNFSNKKFSLKVKLFPLERKTILAKKTVFLSCGRQNFFKQKFSLKIIGHHWEQNSVSRLMEIFHFQRKNFSPKPT